MEPTVTQPEGESKASGLHLSWVGRQLDMPILVAFSLEPPEERSWRWKAGLQPAWWGPGGGETDQGIVMLHSRAL